MLVDLRNKGITGKDAQNMLDEVHITVNKNGIPFDTESPFITSGIRLGTPAVTTRGMKEEDMREIAELINLTLTDFDNSKDNIKERVGVLCKKYPLY
jgi:glycine hydroxymethyltransferase